MAKLDLQTVFKQEQDRLRKLHPTPADVPSCLGLFDDYLSCSGTSLSSPWSPFLTSSLGSHPFPDQINIQIWSTPRMLPKIRRVQILYEPQVPAS
jgi:hypothetical protein